MAPGKRDHDSQRLRGEVLMGKNVQSLLTLVVAIVVWSAPPAFADKRVALVIGNGAYKNAVHLPNPRNDAQDVAASLARTGFETIVGLDLDKAGMDEHAIQFARMARDGDVAIFYCPAYQPICPPCSRALFLLCSLRWMRGA
jgi:hypothetical protein